eukprot:2443422-Rhodomonas_salina.2
MERYDTVVRYVVPCMLLTSHACGKPGGCKFPQNAAGYPHGFLAMASYCFAEKRGKFNLCNTTANLITSNPGAPENQ